jgi:hypothetical protein
MVITDKHSAEILTASSSSQLRLIAVTSSEVLAECYPGHDSSLLSQLGDIDSPVPPHQITQPIITTEIIDGVLQVHVTLTFPFNVISDNIVVQWQRIWYDSSDSSQANVTLPDQLLTRSIQPFADSRSVLLPGVTYNSDYRLDVYATSTMEAIQRVYFYTQMCATPDSTFTVCNDVIDTPAEPTSTVQRNFRKLFFVAVGACAFMALLAVMLCAILVCHHARSRLYMKHVIKSMKQSDNIRFHSTDLTLNRHSFINVRGELDSGIGMGYNSHSFV